MKYYKIKSYAKSNLALNVVGKKNSLHKIESIICFLDLFDEILIKKIENENHKIRFIGKFSSKIKLKNTVSKLLTNIDKRKLLNDKYQIIIRKNIPLEAGLGGGSMNAASILNFFIKKKLIRLKKKELLDLSNLIGSDVKLGFFSRCFILKSNNKIKTISNSKKIYTLIVKPNFGCSTRDIYSKVKKFSKPEFYVPTKNMFNLDFLKRMKNDLEPIVLKKYPKLKILKIFLEKVLNCEFARMTGSGSAIIAYFKSDKDSKNAKKKVKKKFKNYWCVTSKTI